MDNFIPREQMMQEDCKEFLFYILVREPKTKEQKLHNYKLSENQLPFSQNTGPQVLNQSWNKNNHSLAQTDMADRVFYG